LFEEKEIMKANSSLLFITLILGSAFFTGCATTSITQEEIAKAKFAPIPSDIQDKIKNDLAAKLKDPYSAQYVFHDPKKGYSKDGAWTGGSLSFGYIIRVQVNAKKTVTEDLLETKTITIFGPKKGFTSLQR